MVFAVSHNFDHYQDAFICFFALLMVVLLASPGSEGEIAPPIQPWFSPAVIKLGLWNTLSSQAWRSKRWMSYDTNARFMNNAAR